MPPEIRTLENPAPRALVEALRDQIARLEGARRPADERPLSSGCAPVDKLLPGNGFRRGTLVEWLAAGEGSGAETLALLAAREACRQGGALVVLDQSREFYPPAAVHLGIAPEAMIVVQAASPADNLWALDQALRCPGVAAALAWSEKLEGRTFRRLQLAAEQGGGLGLLLRPQQARQEPSWAEVRLEITPLPGTAPRGSRRLRVQLLRARGSASGASAEVELGDETHPLYLASPLARPAAPRRAAGA